MSQQLFDLNVKVNTTKQIPPVTSYFHDMTPEPFSGELEKTRGFLLQCDLTLSRSPRSFSDDAQQISYIIGLLRGRALRWAE